MLCCAVLCESALCCAVLCYVNLHCAVLCCAVLCCAALYCVVCSCTVVRCAVLRYAAHSSSLLLTIFVFTRLPACPSTDAASSFFDDGSGIGAGDSGRFDKVRPLAPMISCPKPRRQDTPSVQSTLSRSPMVSLLLVSLLVLCDDAVSCCVML